MIMHAFRHLLFTAQILLFATKATPCNKSKVNITSSEKFILQKLAERINEPLIFDKLKVSPECQQASNEFFNALNHHELWALQMHDSNAKLPSSILLGNIHQYGDFDGCLRISNGTTQGRFCLTNMQIKMPDHFEFLKRNFVLNEIFVSTFRDVTFIVPRTSEVHWGVCVPSSCSPKDVEIGLRNVLKKSFSGSSIKYDVQVTTNQCHVRDINWYLNLKPSILLVSFIFAAYVIFVIAASVCHHRADSELYSGKWVAAFSITKNLRDILSTDSTVSEIKIIHGIKFVNMALLYYTHKSMFVMSNPHVNEDYVRELTNSAIMNPFRAAYYYTDVFMMISGLLVSYSVIGRLQKGSIINLKKEIIARYLRMMPTLAVVVLFSTFILPHISSGPQWNIITDQADVCEKFWWRNILMIHNWFGMENICLPQTHHIESEFVLYVLSLFLVIYLHNNSKRGTALIIALGVMAMVSRFITSYINQLSVFVFSGVEISNLVKSADYLYALPPQRFSGHAIGILLGHFLRKYDGRKLTKAELWIGNILSSTLFVASVAIVLENLKYSLLYQAIFVSIGSMLFCLSVSWFIIASHFGHRSSLIKALEWKYFKISTKIAFGIHLVQFIVFTFNIGVTRGATYFTIFGTLINLNEVFIVIAGAIFLTLAVEYPFGNIRKFLFKQIEAKHRKNN